MALKSYKPTTPSQRNLVIVDRTGLYRGKPVKSLVEGQNSTGGRNNHGRITSRFRGGGHKQAYRTIDFKRVRREEAATVERIEYDPNRTAFIALVKYKDGELTYILAPQRLAAGDSIVAGEQVDSKAGRQRWKGRMPHNRGITMNPVDHPHGGRTKGGGHPVTPWGFPTKGKKTRKNKSTQKFIMLSRHARKKTS